MDANVLNALEQDKLVDFTTKGRKSGEERRLEIRHHVFDGKVYIAGLRGKKGWYANLVGDANFTLHVKQTMKADVLVKARIITDDAERRKLFPLVIESYASNELTMEHIDEYIETGHIIEVQDR
jgi:hypothetical protein